RFQAGPLGENNAGQIVGQSFGHAVLYSQGVLTDLNANATLSVAKAINNAGQIVGLATLGQQREVVLFSAGGIIPLPALPGTSFRSAFASNASGTVVGSAGISGQGNVFTLCQNGGVSALKLPSGSSFGLSPSNTAINDAGQVAVTVIVQGLGFRGLVINQATG